MLLAPPDNRGERLLCFNFLCNFLKVIFPAIPNHFAEMGLVCLSLRRWISDELLWFGAELLLAEAYCPLSFLLFLPFKHRWTLGEIFFVKKCIFPADLSQPRRRVYNLLNFARESRNSVADLHFSLETVGTQGRDARLPQT